MEQEVPSELQAAMAIKLADDVRKMIRDEVKAALEDPIFIGSLNTFPLAQSTQYHFNPNDYNFQQAVKNVIATQMVKY
jgi:DNA polymerase III psi subunit